MKVFGLTLKKRYVTPLMIVAILVAVRAVLPYFVTKYINKTLQNVEGYTGQIYDVDLYLWKGAYKICDLRMDKIDGKVKAPFLYIPETDLSIEWKSLLKGSIVGEVELQRPTLHFALSDSEAKSQTGAEADWVQLLEDLMPININRFAVNEGTFVLAYKDGALSTESEFKDLSMNVTNIRNVEDKADKLPSTIVATGHSPTYAGYLRLDGRAFFLQNFPDINYNARFEKIKMESLNPLAQHYAGLDFEQGEMDLFSEMAIMNGKIDGYFKPIATDAQIFKWKEEGRSLGQGIKEFFAEGVQELFENHFKGEQTAARVPVQGTIDQTVTLVWPTIFSSLKNAYIEAFQRKLDDTIRYPDESEEAVAAASDGKEKKEKKGFFKRLFGGDDDEGKKKKGTD
ncbi:MAG: DUF748 domain-containing protein [Bacteroidota bacterium]